MKKIFVLTGEPSGDKLASKIVTKLRNTRSDIEYLSVGGEHLNALGIKSLYDLNEITYLGFTRVILNIFKIKRKINHTLSAPARRSKTKMYAKMFRRLGSEHFSSSASLFLNPQILIALTSSRGHHRAFRTV